MGFSSLPNAVYPVLSITSLSILPDALHPNQIMAYSNDADNTSYYSSVSGGLYPYPSPNRMFAIDTEGTNGQLYADPADQRGMVRRSGPMVGSPTGLRTEASFGERRSGHFTGWYLTHELEESVPPATSYTSRTDGYGWPSYDRSANYRRESYHSGYLGRDRSFANTVSETSTAEQTPSSGEYSLEVGAHRPQAVPLDYWGANQSGAPTSTFYAVGFEFNHPCATALTPFHRGT